MFLKYFFSLFLIQFFKRNLSIYNSDFLSNNSDLILLNKSLQENNETYTQRDFYLNNEIYLENLTILNRSKSNKTSRTWTVSNFYLYTSEYKGGKKYELLNPKDPPSLAYTHFRPRLTYILVHGFLGYGLEEWVVIMKNKLLLKSACNVISVDWPAGTEWFLPSYYQAAKRVQPVGGDIGSLLMDLKDILAFDVSQVHCIGHSLGAHVCGFAGKPFKGMMSRITGLDPAGPLFHIQPPKNRLSREDAKYVDVMHTNACTNWLSWTDCYGLNEDIGHSNFYPNGGKYQPGCSSVIGCAHKRAYLYYLSSMDYTTSYSVFLARPCDNYSMYTRGQCPCGKELQFMGYNVKTNLRGKFFLNTTSLPPYGVEDNECLLSHYWLFTTTVSSATILALSILVAILCMICMLKKPSRTHSEIEPLLRKK